MILAIRTDSMTAELYLIDGESQIAQHKWEAARQLAEQLLPQIEELLKGSKSSWDDLDGIIVFRGPGSFTSLRIGATVANTIAYAQNLPIVGTMGDDWTANGIKRLSAGDNDTQVVPHYGAQPNITKPKR